MLGRVANLLIEQHGEGGRTIAAMQGDKRLKAVDVEGRAVWLRVIRAIKELQRTRPRRDEPMH